MVTGPDLRNVIALAKDDLTEVLQAAEREKKYRISHVRASARKQMETVVESPESVDLIDARIGRIRLFLRFLHSIALHRDSLEESMRTRGMQLRISQLRSIHEFIEFLRSEGYGGNAGYFTQPTGAGKTVLFGIIAKLLEVPTLILVPRANLLLQTKTELVNMVGIDAESIGLVGSRSNDAGKQFVIATYHGHTLKMKSDSAYKAMVQGRELVICDEAHRSLGEETRKTFGSFDDDEIGEYDEGMTGDDEDAEDAFFRDVDAYVPDTALKLGFTATPQLSRKHVKDLFRHLIADEKMSELVSAGILVPYRIVHADGSVSECEIERYISEEHEVEILEREKTYEKLLGQYASVITAYRERRSMNDFPLRGVAFCVNIHECDVFKRQAEALGLKATIVTGRETSGSDAESVLRRAEDDLASGEIDIIITVNKLGEGWNFKPANAAIWARATKSPMMIIQGIGRVGRAYVDPTYGKKECAYVFETQWKISGDPQSRRSSKPLTIVDALAINGEDPSAICTMFDGAILEYTKPLTAQEVGSEIRNRFTPETWADLKKDERVNLSFGGQKYGSAIARLFGVKGYPAHENLVHLTIGRAVFGDHPALRKNDDSERRAKISEEIKARFSPETWPALGRIERKNLVLGEERYSMGIAGLFGVAADPTRNFPAHLAVGRAVWGNHPALKEQEESDVKTLIIQEIKERFSPESWSELRVTDKKNLVIGGRKYGMAIAGLFGVLADPSANNPAHLAFGRAIWGDHPALLDRQTSESDNVDKIELRDRVLIEMQRRFTPESWVRVKQEEKKVLMLGGHKYGKKIAAAFGKLGNPVNNHSVHLSIGRDVWGNHPALLEKEELKKRMIQEIQERFTPETWQALGKKQRRDLFFCERKYGSAIANMFDVIGDPANNFQVHLAIGRKVWGDDCVALQGEVK